MSTPAGQPTSWQQLPESQQRLLFERLQNRIDSRAAEMTELRRFFVKALVASNATAAAATLAFAGTIRSHSLSQVATCGYATFIFGIGFVSAIACLLIAVSRSRETLIAESEYLDDIIAKGVPIHWHDNPNILRLSPFKLGVGLLFAVLSAICLLIGVSLVLYLLIVTLPGSLPIPKS